MPEPIEQQIDIEDLVKSLCNQIAEKSKQVAILEATIAKLTKPVTP